MGGLFSSQKERIRIRSAEEELSGGVGGQPIDSASSWCEILTKHGYSKRVIELSSYIFADSVDGDDASRFVFGKLSDYLPSGTFDVFHELFDNGNLNVRVPRGVDTVEPENALIAVKDYKLGDLLKNINSFGMFTDTNYKYWAIITVNGKPFDYSEIESMNKNMKVDQTVDLQILKLRLFKPCHIHYLENDDA